MPDRLDLLSVDHILEERRHRIAPKERLTYAAISFALHVVLTVGFVLLPILFEKPEMKLEFVSVMVVPPSALGTEEPPPPPPPPPPRPAPPPPAEIPPPPAPPPPKPAEAPPEDLPVLPPKKPSKKPVEPPPPAPPPAKKPPVEAPAKRRGSPFGSSLGTSTQRAIVGVEDPNFTFGYYLDRVAASITANWVRPPVEDEIEKAHFYFRVLREGEITALELTETSGSEVFDQAARRAIEASSPLPPLPRGYKPDFLGIHLIVR